MKEGTMNQAQSHNEKKDRSFYTRRSYTPSPCVILAEADPDVRCLLKYSLNKFGYSVIECAHGAELIIRLGVLAAGMAPERVDLVISDVRLPGMDSREVFDALRKEPEAPQIIWISSSRKGDVSGFGRKLRPVSIFSHPFGVDELLEKVMKVVPPETCGVAAHII